MTYTYYLMYFFASLFISCILTYIVRTIALRTRVVDIPTGERKIHKQPIPLLGGVAILLTFFIIVLIASATNNVLYFFPFSRIIGVLIASAIIFIAGMLDDSYNMSPAFQFISILMASAVVAISGTGVNVISNPFGGILYLSSFIGCSLVFFWLTTLSLTTKILDGLDGLVTGITIIGALIIGIFSLFTKYYQPDIALISFILAGSCAGFLIWNIHPAKIFLGNVGSIWLGFILGVLAVISGGKLAIALLVLGMPIIDMIVVLARRIYDGHSPWKGDTTHLHFQLLSIGWKQRTVVYVYWLVAMLFGALTIVLQSTGKFIALILLFFLTGIVLMIVGRHNYVK